MNLYAHAIYGPPGCGKTTALMGLINTLISQDGYGPESIAFVSHTKAAASEALQRLGLTRSDKVSTIHSLAYRMLSLSSSTLVDFRRLNEFAQLVNVPMKNGNVESEEGIEVGDEYLAIQNKARSRIQTYEAEYEQSERPGSLPEYISFCRSYDEWKKQNGYIDFTDMLERFVAYSASGRLPHFDAKVLLVDEAQDLSPLQWAVVDILIESVERVYIAGDDDQAIYVWGGADPAGMVDFQKRYDAGHTLLRQSYRVPKKVQAVAFDIIGQVQSRVAKPYAPRSEEGRVERYSYLDAINLAHGQDVLVLCRTGAQKKEVERHMVDLRIPYLMDGGKPGKYQTKAAKALRVFRKLERGESISNPEFEALQNGVRREYKEDVQARSFAKVLKLGVMKAIDVPPWDYDFYRTNLDQLELTPTIKISSIHGSKGREADRVILHTGMTERTMMGMDRDPDAEHRVFYVGATRAKNRLDILYGHNGYVM